MKNRYPLTRVQIYNDKDEAIVAYRATKTWMSSNSDEYRCMDTELTIEDRFIKVHFITINNLTNLKGMQIDKAIFLTPPTEDEKNLIKAQINPNTTVINPLEIV